MKKPVPIPFNKMSAGSNATPKTQNPAKAASISWSEAARCFHEYMGCSPVNALIRYRLQTAHRLLHDSSLTVQEISLACGFRSTNYFTRQFRKNYGYTPGKVRCLGK